VIAAIAVTIASAVAVPSLIASAVIAGCCCGAATGWPSPSGATTGPPIAACNALVSIAPAARSSV